METAVDSARSGRRSAAGFKAFLRIAKRWRLREDEALTLLGSPSRAAFYKWQNQVPSRGLTHDALERISYVLGIYKALHLLFNDPEQADGWVRRPNEAFGGQTALERMLGGNVVDLYAVRSYLDFVRGGYS